MNLDARAVLRARVADAIAELAELDRVRDPAATGAVHTIRLTARTLTSFWEPALGDDA